MSKLKRLSSRPLNRSYSIRGSRTPWRTSEEPWGSGALARARSSAQQRIQVMPLTTCCHKMTIYALPLQKRLLVQRVKTSHSWILFTTRTLGNRRSTTMLKQRSCWRLAFSLTLGRTPHGFLLIDITTTYCTCWLGQPSRVACFGLLAYLLLITYDRLATLKGRHRWMH